MSAADLHRWIENMRAAASRDREARRDTPLSPAESWRRACELLAFAKRLGTPPADDDEARVQATWVALRHAFGAP